MANVFDSKKKMKLEDNEDRIKMKIHSIITQIEEAKTFDDILNIILPLDKPTQGETPFMSLADVDVGRNCIKLILGGLTLDIQRREIIKHLIAQLEITKNVMKSIGTLVSLDDVLEATKRAFAK